MTYFRSILFLILITGCFAVKAQQAEVTAPLLSLKDAVGIALDKNFDIRIAKVSAEENKVNNTIGNAGMLPSVSAIGSVSKSVTDAKIELANGTVQNRNNAHSQVVSGAVQMNWVLFDGLRMFVTKDRLDAMERMGVTALKNQIQSTVSQVISTYASVVYQKQLLIALDTAMSLEKVRMDIAQKNFEIGTADKTGFLQAQVDYNASKSSSILQNAKLRQVKDSLMLLLGRDQFADYDVEDSLYINTELTFNESSVWMDNNFDVQMAAQQKELSVFDLKLAKGAQLPVLSLAAAYNYNRSQNDAGTSLFNRTYGPQAGLNLSLPIFDGFNLQRQKKIARLEVNRQDLVYQYTQVTVATQYRIAWRAYENAKATFDLEKENIQYAEENVMIQQARFRVGVTNTLALRDAENSYVAALARLVDAKYALKIAGTKILTIENKLVQ